MEKITTEQLENLKFRLEGNRWVHEKGTYIYANKMDTYTLNDVVNILTGTAFKKGQTYCIPCP